MQRLNEILNRWRSSPIATGIFAIALVILLLLVFAPGLREALLSRLPQFRQASTPPAPAVPPGQLRTELEKEQSASGSITIDPNTAASLGLQTATVETRVFDQAVRATGRVTPDERLLTHVHTKVDGWIEKTFANFEGEQIRKGEPLFTLYSPDLVATQQEYLLALRARRNFDKSEFEEVRESGEALVEAARRRLQLWDVTPEQIGALERTGQVTKAITIYSPASGIITERKAFPGLRIMPDTDLYSLADLSSVWVEASVFESDLPNINIGTLGQVTLPGGEVRSGRVTYINPMVDPQTRTAKVRLDFANPGLHLKPGMFVDVNLQIKTRPQLVVPSDAVLDTGVRKLVLVDDGNGRFSLRAITTGTLNLEFYTVLSGLSSGERVARNIQFLIDSETPLRQAIEQQNY